MTLAVTVGALPLEALLARLRTHGVRFNAYAEHLFAQGAVPVAERPTTLAVVVRPLAELGFPEGALLRDALAAAPALGLAPCPLEAGLWLRLTALSAAPRITLAAPRALPGEDAPRGLYLRDDAEGAWLRGYVASDDWVFTPDERLAFVRSRRSSPRGGPASPG